MTNAGAQDWLRGIATPQVNGGSALGSSTSLVANVAPSAECLLVFAEHAQPITITSVIGITTLAEYPFIPYGNISAGAAPMWIVPVSNPTDTQVSINLASAPGQTWLAVNDQGIRATADGVLAAILNQNGTPSAGTGLLVLGRDITGTARILQVDSNGRLAVGDPNVPQGAIPQIATVSTGRVTVSSNSTAPVLAAPSSGAWYLEYADFENFALTTPGSIYLLDSATNTGANEIAEARFNALGGLPGIPIRQRVTTGVWIGSDAGTGTTGGVVLRYAPGP